MCGVSGIEFVVILVVAVIVLGPERLPEAMRTLGKMARELRKITDDFSDVRDEFTRDFREELERDTGQKKSTAQQTAQRRAKAGRAGQDVPEIDQIRAQQAAEAGEHGAADADDTASATHPVDEIPEPDDHPLAASTSRPERPLPTLKPATGAIESEKAPSTTSTSSALETTPLEPTAEPTLPPPPAAPVLPADPDSGDVS